MPNRLAHSTSPYLRQHAENPVDWYPWGTEALERARAERRPILLSVGYAACHWCHVMAHESFEDAETARVMNELYVNIKVDREERPDIDSIYMQAVQAMTGQGGWPMTMFLTPEGVPFHAGTYFPPEDRHGLPSFRRVLRAVADAYRSQPDRIAETTASVLQFYREAGAAPQTGGPVTAHTLELAYRSLAQQFDVRFAGFGGAPKFPPTMALEFLLRYARRRDVPYALDMVTETFRAMSRGGIYDQIGGGFARYSVDARWLVPHFEKMLYDNALLVHLGAQLWQATKDPDVRAVVEETVLWVVREMRAPSGGFYSSLDADSEGEEGRYYVWAPSEIDAVVGSDGPVVRAYFGVTDEGNFEGRNILHVPVDRALVAARADITEARVAETIERARSLLRAARETRVRPGLDDKLLACWNGLMVRGIAEAGRAFDRDDFRALALAGGEFLWREMVRDGRVVRSRGHESVGFLDDHAAVALAFLSLYEVTFETRWIDRARAVADAMLTWYADDATGILYDTARDAEALVTRPRDIMDNAVPSGTSLAIDVMLRLAELTGDEALRRRATQTLDAMAELLARHPTAFGHALCAADMAVHGAVEIAIVADPASEDFQVLARAAGAAYAPARVMAGGVPRHAPGLALLDGRSEIDGRATAYVCRGYACDLPVTDAAALTEQLQRAGRA